MCDTLTERATALLFLNSGISDLEAGMKKSFSRGNKTYGDFSTFSWYTASPYIFNDCVFEGYSPLVCSWWYMATGIKGGQKDITMSVCEFVVRYCLMYVHMPTAYHSPLDRNHLTALTYVGTWCYSETCGPAYCSVLLPIH